MARQSAIGVGLLGLGVIGSHVASRLLDPAAADAFGQPSCCGRALVRRLDLPRDVALPDGTLTNDFTDVLADDGIDIVVEAMGGEHPAVDYLTQLLSKGAVW